MDNLKNSFIMYYEYAQHFASLSDVMLGKLVRAVFEYEIHQTLPKLTGTAQIAFSFVKTNLDRDRVKYNARIKANSKNSKLGGRPVSSPNQHQQVVQQPKKTDGLFLKPKKPDNENDNDIDNENENENDNVNVNENDNEGRTKVQVAPCVHMHPHQLRDLQTKYGKAATAQMIDMLNNYKAACGREYCCDYSAILRWVVGKYKKEGADGGQVLPPVDYEQENSFV